MPFNFPSSSVSSTLQFREGSPLPVSLPCSLLNTTAGSDSKGGAKDISLALSNPCTSSSVEVPVDLAVLLGSFSPKGAEGAVVRSRGSTKKVSL